MPRHRDFRDVSHRLNFRDATQKATRCLVKCSNILLAIWMDGARFLIFIGMSNCDPKIRVKSENYMKIAMTQNLLDILRAKEKAFAVEKKPLVYGTGAA